MRVELWKRGCGKIRAVTSSKDRPAKALRIPAGATVGRPWPGHICNCGSLPRCGPIWVEDRAMGEFAADARWWIGWR